MENQCNKDKKMNKELVCPLCGGEMRGNAASPSCMNQDCEMYSMPISRSILDMISDLSEIVSKLQKSSFGEVVSTKVTVDSSYLENLITENARLKQELAQLKGFGGFINGLS